MPEQPIYARMYSQEPYVEFTRFIGYQGVPLKDVQATMKEGILTIRLPKTKQATRRVQIRA